MSRANSDDFAIDRPIFDPVDERDVKQAEVCADRLLERSSNRLIG
jgi:hypothetical protein